MDVLKARSSRFFSTLPVRLYRALPAVILGSLFNILDTISIGILVFPATDGAFRALQLQGLSMFIMSTLASQVVMTLGGSGFPGALGAMLMEILPFLRGVANDIRGALGDDHPGLIPTVMAAYALTSFFTGFAFIILGILRLGNLVAYFPQTVLTGAIGAIGVSLFVLGLGLPFPPSETPLALGNVRSTLFDQSHLGILAASFFPAFVLSVTLRSQVIAKWTRGLVRSAYYIPVYLLCIPAVFWIVARSLHFSNQELIAKGWLFTVDSASTSSAGIAASWNYWTLFDFKLIEWRAVKSATQNIVLLVVIGVLNLPIFVPSLAFSLGVAYDMNHELIGQGAANILAGALGTLPNILQYSYSFYVTRANGGRFELWLIILVTGVLFLTAGLMLPYVPTVLASGMVLFLGIELFLGATWEACESLTGMEFFVVLATLAACTFIGFAEGFGVGIGAAAVVYLIYGVIDSPAQTTRWAEGNETGQGDIDKKKGNATPSADQRQSQRDHIPDEIALEELNLDASTAESSDSWRLVNARVVLLSGYIFFASVPSLEKKILDSKIPTQFIILDLARAHRIETTAARALARCVRELALTDSILIICGLAQDSGLHADFTRADVPLVFDAEKALEEKEIRVFPARAPCMAWCQQQCRRLNKTEKLDDQATEDAFRKFCDLFHFDMHATLGPFSDDTLPAGARSAELKRFIQNGGRISSYLPGQAIEAGIVFVINGQITLINSVVHTPGTGTPTRPSLRSFLTMIPHMAVDALRARWSGDHVRRRITITTQNLHPGEVSDLRTHWDVCVAITRTVIVHFEGESLMPWAEARLRRQAQAV
ncbi:sulfate transporter family-domain-containing protein [Mycena vitilis]|nr:sulfate transporter family-domain-containing protein [Mycena vitilis]